MKKINLFVLEIVLLVMLAVFMFTACSINNAPLDESTAKDAPFDEKTRVDTTKNDTAENDSSGGMEEKDC